MTLRHNLGYVAGVLLLTLHASALVTVLGASEVVLAVNESEEHGAHVVSVDGWSLYATVDDLDAGASTCVEACAERWPPLLVVEGEGLPQGDGLDGALIGTIERTDGSHQVTYAGWPLHRFSGDDVEGATLGHDVDEAWFLVSAEGQLIGAELDGRTDVFEQLMHEGAQVYRNVCATCHGGAGGGGQGPRLAGNPRVGDAAYVVDTVLRGFGYMPGFGRQLSDADVAAVATYVRNSWDNEYPLVSEQEVSRVR